MMHVLSIALLGVILVLEFAVIVETILADRMRNNRRSDRHTTDRPVRRIETTWRRSVGNFFESTEGGISISRLWATATSRERIRRPLFSIHDAEQNGFLGTDAACGLSALPDRALQYFLRYGLAEILKELPAERVKLEFNLRGLGLGRTGEQAAFPTSIITWEADCPPPTRTRSGVPGKRHRDNSHHTATIAAIPMLGGLDQHCVRTSFR
jgi:hypothetical protein